jgi:Chalcone isomerase-like
MEHYESMRGEQHMLRIMVIVSLSIMSTFLQSAEVAGVRLEAAAKVGEHTLTLRGADLLRWKWIVKIYVAALYVPANTKTSEILGEIPRRIEFHYRRGFTAEQLVEATNGTINRGRDDKAIAAIAAEVAAFNALYPAVVEGDVMAIEYLPGVGTTMRINNVARGAAVVGAEFSKALFAIWVGDNAVDDDLKTALLGKP